MCTKSREPKPLRKGREFHQKLQNEWHKTVEGEIKHEKPITKLSGRKGRIDIFVSNNEKLVAVVEIKDSDWNKMIPAAVQRNVRRQARQIWDYIESQLQLKRDVSPGIIFPKRPKDPARMNLIEQLFEDEGIPVVWQDESIAERKARLQSSSKKT